MNIKSELQKYFRPRRASAHKGDFGKIFILAGSRGLSGACVLASSAALRSGAGLVTVGVPNSLVLPLAKRMTEAMTKGFPETKEGTLSTKAVQPITKFLKGQDVLAIGPGLSGQSDTKQAIQKIILTSKIPMVIDADGLNAFKGKVNLFRRLKAPAVLTPHHGEFMRLFGGNIPKTDAEREQKAVAMARKHKVVLVLKGYHTVVASPKGDVYVNQTGNSGMATGGSGDVLTGIIAALLGQGLSSFQAACSGVYVHGLAGDLVKKEKGEISLIASDIISAFPKAFQKALRK